MYTNPGFSLYCILLKLYINHVYNNFYILLLIFQLCLSLTSQPVNFPGGRKPGNTERKPGNTGRKPMTFRRALSEPPQSQRWKALV